MILLLRGDREYQMVLDQPRNQARIVAAHTLLEAERLGIYRAEDGVVAARALSRCRGKRPAR